MGGLSFLTPLDALFALAAVVPLAALVAVERRSERVRRAFGLALPRRRVLAPVVLALVLLPALVAVAAAQPIVVRERFVRERADAQAFFVLDTSLSMSARPSLTGASRLARAKAAALRLRSALGDVPVGIATMTDRTLPNLMPTTDVALFRRTLAQSVSIDSPPPSQPYRDRATTLEALIPISESKFFSPGVVHRILVVFTDGEASRLPSSAKYEIRRGGFTAPLLVHVWGADDRVYRNGRPDPRYVPDPTSSQALADFAQVTAGRAFDVSQLGDVAAAVQAMAGKARAHTTVDAYARVALAPWFVLAGVVPLGFLLWRRNL